MDDVKPLGRAYASARRHRQAQQTKSDILDAAQDLFVRVGYAATTMAAVAAEAGVAPATVYAGFASKRGLLEAVMDRIVARGREPAPVEAWPEFRAAMSETDPGRTLARAALVVREVNERAALLAEITAAVDPDLAELNRTYAARRHEDTRTLINALADRGMLAPGLSAAAASDVAWALNGPEVYQLLVTRRGWSSERYEHWLAETLTALLIAPRTPTGPT
jgi:AcrR family transcriptional regulator